jgi:3-isopropylmalate/(R)-2-methylmalate dehydratase small subunit
VNPIRGRVWLFGDSIDTDVMFPGFALRLPIADAAQHLFDSIRPGWASQVEPGDIVVGGTSFGVGSARPVASLLRHVGIQAVLAESMTTLFQRNCFNDGLLALPARGVTQLCSEGEVITIEPDTGQVTNEHGDSIHLVPVPPFVASMLEAGGVLGVLRRDGYLPQS